MECVGQPFYAYKKRVVPVTTRFLSKGVGDFFLAVYVNVNGKI